MVSGQSVTLGPEKPWASTVSIVPPREPLRFLWYSQRHSRQN